MLSFFRRLINSKAGVVVTFVVLGVIALAFAAGDVTGLQSGSKGGVTGSDAATVGGTAIGVAELREAANQELTQLRQQRPDVDAAQFVAQGGLEAALQRLITGTALATFGTREGMVVSKRFVDGQIASIPALQGPTGKFDQALYERILADRRLTDAQIRRDIVRDTIAQQLTIPTVGASQVPAQLALPYASLLLERRGGLVGFVPVSAVPAGPAPGDAELAVFYARNVSRYTLPERRIARYMLVTPADVRAQATPSEAEIARAYAADRARYAPSQTRTVSQVVLPTQAAATALAARVRAGTSPADAARALGLEASTQTLAKPAYAALATPAMADAVFAAARGGIVGPFRSPLGWTVARVDAVTDVPGRTLAQARDTIAAELGKTKLQEALANARDGIDQAITGNATFDEVAADRKLTARTTPALTAAGIDPENPTAKPDPALAPIVAGVFAADEGDEPQLVQTGADGSFALVAIGRVVPSAPRPLAQMRDIVARDFVADRSRQAARKVAVAALAKAERGVPLARALAETGLPVPAPRPLSVPRSQLAANPRGAEPTLALLFSMPQGATKLLEAPNRSGWLLVQLSRIEAGDARRQPPVIAAARGDLGRVIGREYAEQFARAVRGAIGVSRDDTAVARVRDELTGRPQDN